METPKQAIFSRKGNEVTKEPWVFKELYYTVLLGAVREVLQCFQISLGPVVRSKIAESHCILVQAE